MKEIIVAFLFLFIIIYVVVMSSIYVDKQNRDKHPVQLNKKGQTHVSRQQ